MPNVSAWPSCTSCAAGWGAARGKSSCLLVYHGTLGQTAKARLATMRETDDGFVIAEQDLKLRGPGEVLGRRQSGMEEFRLADPVAHSDLAGGGA